MRQNIFYLMISLVFIVLISSVNASNYFNLLSFVHSYEDVQITANDLAFVLATHGYDARPIGDKVVVNQDGEVYKLIPNGIGSGLATIRG